MRSAIRQVVIPFDAGRAPARLPALPVRAAVMPDRTLPVMLGVTVLHLAALFLLLHQWERPQAMPVLSFTVTFTDLASSPNTVSAAASAPSAPAVLPEPQKTVEKAVDKRPAVRKAAKTAPVSKPAPRTNAPVSHSSRQQAAVLAPIVPAQYNAAYLNNPQPFYPPLSRRLGEQGRGMLRVYVAATGQPETVQLSQSSGFDRLDSAALDAVKRWRFAAARQGEQVVASWVNVPFKFILE